MRKKGFTLIELLIVIAIIAILAGAMIPLFNISSEKAREAKAIAEMDVIKTAAVMLHHDTGHWPNVSTAGDDFITDVTEWPSWNGPYLDEWRNDPWGDHPYEIWDEAVGNKRYINCWGPDKTDDDGADDDIKLLLTPDKTK